MWKISMTTYPNQKDGGNVKVITTSYYQTEKEALAAAEQLRLLNHGWCKSCRDVECERKNAPTLKWRHNNYLITQPVSVSNAK